LLSKHIERGLRGGRKMKIANVENIRRENNNAREIHGNKYNVTVEYEGENLNLTIITNYFLGCIDGIVHATNKIDHSQHNGYPIELKVLQKDPKIKNNFSELELFMKKEVYKTLTD
jgi:hypothetical protein